MRAAAQEILTYLCEVVDITTRHLAAEDVVDVSDGLKAYLDKKTQRPEAA